MIADFWRAIDARRMAGRTHLSKRQLSGGRHGNGRRCARGRAQCRQGRIVFPRDGNLRERRNVLLHTRKMQRLQEHRLSLAIGSHRARYRKQHDGKGDEQTQHHAEGIEELGI